MKNRPSKTITINKYEYIIYLWGQKFRTNSSDCEQNMVYTKMLLFGTIFILVWYFIYLEYNVMHVCVYVFAHVIL